MGKKKRPKAEPYEKTRKFEGKEFTSPRGHRGFSKRDAKKLASDMRGTGSQARIVKGRHGWDVYDR